MAKKDLNLNKLENASKHSPDSLVPDPLEKASLTEAMHFLAHHPIGQRLYAAEHALTLLVKNELPRLRQYVFNAVFELKGVDSESLSSKASDERGASIKVNFEEEGIQVSLHYSSLPSSQDSVLFSRCFGEVISATYAALGLDMSGNISIDEL